MRGGLRTQVIRAAHSDDPLPSEEERAIARAALKAEEPPVVVLVNDAR